MGEILRKTLDIFDLGAAPAVNRLVVVAYRRYTRFFARKHAQPSILHAVGILKLIDQHKGKTITVMFEDMWLIEPKLVGAQ